MWFYGTSTTIDYLMLNPLYTYILNMICKRFVDNIFKWAWTQFFFAQLNGFKHFYLTWIILFTINNLFAHTHTDL